MQNSFTAHNIRLDDGSETFPSAGWLIDQSTVLRSVVRLLSLIYPDGLRGKSIVDLGFLEGGYAAEFARLGMLATGIEGRESNFQNCLFVKSKTDLPNLTLVKDDANNIGKYGPFDVVFANGLLYHLDQPKKFLADASRVCRDAIFLQTHVASLTEGEAVGLHRLSELTENEGLRGRWYPEYEDAGPEELEQMKWASWSNKRSFWVLKQDLLQTLYDLGFSVVLEQFDYLSHIGQEMTDGFYKTNDRVLVVGIRAQASALDASSLGLVGENAALRSELAQMRASKSWRITAPLRKLRFQLMRGTRG